MVAALGHATSEWNAVTNAIPAAIRTTEITELFSGTAVNLANESRLNVHLSIPATSFAKRSAGPVRSIWEGFG
jgi:hypothetical protein